MSARRRAAQVLLAACALAGLQASAGAAATPATPVVSTTTAISTTVATTPAGTSQAAPAAVPPSAEPAAIRTPAEHLRTPDQTFLTFPEWYLVHSPAEYAAYLGANSAPSGFPLFSHIGQFWQGYAAVAREIERYPFNAGYHLMVMVIGVSTTVEYALKGLYEATIGRIAEATANDPDGVPETRFAARYAQAYVDFIRVDPWYLFDFASQLRALWYDHPLSLHDADLVRRLERRFALTTELLVKEGYARLIKLGTETIYEAARPVTAVTLSRAPAAGTGGEGYTLLASDPASRQVLATIPRYEAFGAHAHTLAAQGIDFVRVAGNDGEILVSLLCASSAPAASGRLLFTQPTLTRPGHERRVLAVPVASLAALLRASTATGVTVEHVYDF